MKFHPVMTSAKHGMTSAQAALCVIISESVPEGSSKAGIKHLGKRRPFSPCIVVNLALFSSMFQSGTKDGHANA